MTSLKPIGIKDFFEYKFISNINISDDKKNTIFTVKEVDETNNTYKSYLYLQKENKTIKLTSSGKDSNYIFDGNDALYILANREDEKRAQELEQFTPVYHLSLKGGEATKVFEIPLNVSSVKVVDKNTWILLASIDKKYPDYYKLSKKEQDIIRKEYKDNKDYEEIDESPFWFNGAGFINGHRNALFLFDVKKKKLKRISEVNENIGSIIINDKTVYYVANAFNDVLGRKSIIKSYDINNNAYETVLSKPASIHEIFWLKNELYAFISLNKQYGINENALICQIKDDKIIEFYAEDVSYGSSVGSDVRMGKNRHFKVDNDVIYFIETKVDHACLCSLDAKGNKKYLYDDLSSVEGFDVKDGRVVLCLLKSDELQELYELNDGKIKKLTTLNKKALQGKYVGKPQEVFFKSNGLNFKGWIIYPKDYDKDKKYPAILDIHGGPKTVYGDIFYHEMRYWASNGYFVFFTNPVGSDGRGNTFADIRGKYGVDEYKNLMDFTDYVLDQVKTIDDKNVFVTGGSYGGYMTNWIVGHTDRFKAAATQRSISNWTSFEGVSDIGPDFAKDQNDASVFENLEKVFDRSPLKYAKNVKTPTLFIHSDEDYRCPLEQGIQFYTAIKQNGVEAKMVIFHGENHELSRSGKPLHRVKRLDEITKWFNNHKGE